jgi:hypothetical protein
MLLPKDAKKPLRAKIIRMASTFGRYGYPSCKLRYFKSDNFSFQFK